MVEHELLALDLCAAASLIEHKDLDPVELAEAYLGQIERTEPELNAYVTVDADGALADAARARDEVAAGLYRGPLHGIPVGIKDLFDTAGLRTTYGSARYANHVPTSDAVAVARLRSAGAVILGKHATHEFAWGGRTDSPHFGPTHNPHDHDRVPGGSSGGGAASVVARSCLLALGSDTAGSVRIPAALSGCVGLKPSRDWISTTGAYPLAPSLDHVGLLMRTVDDAACATAELAGRDRDVPWNGRVRVGFLVGESFELLDETVRDALLAARQAVGAGDAEVVDVELAGVTARTVAILTLVKAEAEAVHRDSFRADPGSYGPDLAELLGGPPVDAPHLDEARRIVAESVEDVRGALGDVDVLMSATEPIVAPLIGQMSVELGGRSWHVEHLLTRLTSVANAAGLPAISVPAPRVNRDILPVGVQFMSERHRVPAMLAAARLLREA